MSSSTARLIPLFPFATSKEPGNESKGLVQRADGRLVDVEITDTAEDVIANSDEALIAHLCTGNIAALGLLFRRYARVVRSVAYRILRDTFEADDLLQEIFILVHKKAATFDSSKASVRFWILQMTYHQAISRRRYLACRHFYSSIGLEDAESQLPDSQNTVERLERELDSAAKNSELQKLMAGLSDSQQKTLRLYFFQGYTLDEIAAELGQTRDNIRNHYFRGLNKLRKQIFPNGNGRKPL